MKKCTLCGEKSQPYLIIQKRGICETCYLFHYTNPESPAYLKTSLESNEPKKARKDIVKRIK